MLRYYIGRIEGVIPKKTTRVLAAKPHMAEREDKVPSKLQASLFSAIVEDL